MPEPAERLVSLSDAERAALLAHWTVQRDQADAAVEAWIVALNTDPARRLDPAALEQQSGVPAARIARLLLNDHSTAWTGTGAHRYDRFNPLLPIPLVRPLVLRARVGEPIKVRVENQIRGRRVGLPRAGGRAGRAAGHAVRGAVRRRGAHRPEQRQHHRVRGEPDLPVRRAVRGRVADQRPGRRPRHPGGQQRPRPVRRAGRRAEGHHLARPGDRRRADVRGPCGRRPLRRRARNRTDPKDHKKDEFVDFYSDTVKRSFREFAVFLHDEPEIASGLHTEGEHTVMPLSYRAEPMPNRLPHRMRRLAERTPARPAAGPDRDRPHGRRAASSATSSTSSSSSAAARTARSSSGWRARSSTTARGCSASRRPRCCAAYKGDPARIRLVHGGVKETHVFHLHVHQWRAVPQDTAEPSVWGLDGTGALKHKGSQLLDSITIGPQTGFDIDPLYGSGSRQHARRRHHLALPPLSPLPPRHVGAVAQLRPPGRRHPGLPRRHPVLPVGRASRAHAGAGAAGQAGLPVVHRRRAPAEVAAPARAARRAHGRPAPAAGDGPAHAGRARRLRPGRGGRPTARGRCSSTWTG